jgi:NTP pyrophosphatase (non-canonical NTP hydrolase)
VSRLYPTSVQGLREVAALCHGLACEKGWWPRGTGVDAISTDEVLAKLALIHSEVSEALEVARDPKARLNVQWEEGRVTGPDSPMPKPEGFGVELADVVIRVFDLAGALGIDIAKCIETKHTFNATRPQRHGGKRA